MLLCRHQRQQSSVGEYGLSTREKPHSRLSGSERLACSAGRAGVDRQKPPGGRCCMWGADSRCLVAVTGGYPAPCHNYWVCFMLASLNVDRRGHIQLASGKVLLARLKDGLLLPPQGMQQEAGRIQRAALMMSPHLCFYCVCRGALFCHRAVYSSLNMRT